VSESSDIQQASIVFLGRESFRMQVVDGDAVAIPGTSCETTQRIIERRINNRRLNERRKPLAVTAEVAALPEPLPSRRNAVIAISLAALAGGVLVATAVSQARRDAGSERIAQVERVQPATMPAPQPPPQSVAIAPIPKPEPAPLPALAPPLIPPPAVEPRPEKRPLRAKAAPLPRGGAAAVRPRRPAPPASTRATEVKATPAPPAKPPARRPWVDPFAE
jgi:hypothetical protein